MSTDIGREGHLLVLVSHFGGAVGAGLGLAALFGWILAVPLLTSFGDQLIPMAPSTALLLGSLGVAVVLCASAPSSRAVRRIGLVISCIGVLATLTLFVSSSQRVYSDLEFLGIPITGTVMGAPAGHMSPLTALSLLLASLSLLLTLSASSNHTRRLLIALVIAFPVILINYVLCISYFSGIPLLYNSVFIPPALPTNLALVALGLALLAFARTQERRQGDPISMATARGTLYLLIILIALVLGIATAGFAYYSHYQSQHIAEVENQVTAIGNLKIGDIVQWRRERLGDAAVLYRNIAFTDLVRRYFQDPRDEQAQIRAWLEKYPANYHYDQIFLIDAAGKVQLSLPTGGVPLSAAISQRIPKVLGSRQVTFEDFSRNEFDQQIYLSILVPILDEQDGDRAIGLVDLRIDPRIYLYPLIEQWPTPSDTGETLLVRRDGNDALFLNELRFEKETALKRRNSLLDPKTLTAQAVLGVSGIVQGTDYRGVPVMGFVHAVPDSPWYLVARIDMTEVLAPLTERLLELTILVGALLFGSGAGVGLVWRQQRDRFYRERYQSLEALRETSDTLRTMVETSPLAIISIDLQGIILSWNSAAETTFGWSAAEAIGQPNPTAASDKQQEIAEIRSQVLGGRVLLNYETERLRKDGSRIAVSFSVAPLRDAAGRAKGLLAVVSDITERKLAEQEIHKLNTELEQRVVERTAQLQSANKELEAFSYSVSHDLRAPLRAIDGYARILLEDYASALDTEGKRLFAVVCDQAARMGQLIDDLLTFSRLGRAAFRSSLIDMGALASSVFDELTTPETRAHIQFHNATLPPSTGDPTLIRQVWVNLLSNAIKFSSKREPPIIEIGGKASDTENEYYVRDNGAGFDMEYIGKLFGVFQRLHSDSEYSGTGVGLAIVQRVVHRHGGRVWAEGEVDQGATFHFSLPRKGESQ